MVNSNEIINKIMEYANDKSSKYFIVAKYIVDHFPEIPQTTLKKVALDTNFSASSITRFAQSTGCQGYSQLQNMISFYLTNGGNINDTLTEYAFKDNYIENYYKDIMLDIHNTYKALKQEHFNQAADLVLNAQMTVIYAPDGMMDLANNYSYKSSMTKVPLCVARDLKQLTYLVEHANSDTVFIVLHFAGNDKLLNPLIKQAKVNQAKLISITKATTNPLKSYADVSFDLITKENYNVNMNAISLFSTMLIFELLFYTVINRQKNKYLDDTNDVTQKVYLR